MFPQHNGSQNMLQGSDSSTFAGRSLVEYSTKHCQIDSWRDEKRKQREKKSSKGHVNVFTPNTMGCCEKETICPFLEFFNSHTSISWKCYPGRAAADAETSRLSSLMAASLRNDHDLSKEQGWDLPSISLAAHHSSQRAGTSLYCIKAGDWDIPGHQLISVKKPGINMTKQQKLRRSHVWVLTTSQFIMQHEHLFTSKSWWSKMLGLGC